MNTRNYNITINHEIGPNTMNTLDHLAGEALKGAGIGILLMITFFGGIALLAPGSACSSGSCVSTPSALERMIKG